MSFTAATYKTLVDSRPVGSEVVVDDYTTLPTPAASGYYTYRILELPLDVVTPPSATDAVYVQAVDPTTHIPTGEVFTAVYAPTLPTTGQFQIDNVATFTLGTIVFNQLDGGKTVQIVVTGRGSLLFSSDVNGPCAELTEARSTFASIGDRFDSFSGYVIKRVDYIAGTASGTYTGSLSIFNLPWTYNVGTSQLLYYANGLLQTISIDYSESSSSSVTTSSPLLSGTRVSFVNFN